MSDATLRERTLRRLLRGALRLRRRLPRRPRTNDRGDALDPDLSVLCRLEALQRVDVAARTVPDARAGLVSGVRVVEGAPRALARVEDLDAGGVPARLYAPDGDGLPVLVYLHGGGWVCGDLRSHDRLCRRLAADGRQVVVAVDYRRAPEHPYPAALHDVVTALSWVRATLGGPGVAVGGDSAGGNLAAAACLVLRDRGEPQPAFQLLVYPGLDLRRLSASYRNLGRGFLLTADSIDWYIDHYGADPLDPRASVVLEPDLAGLAPAVVATAGFDPLRDDGEVYAQRLAAAGVPVAHHAFPSLVHGFANMDGAVPAASRAVDALAEACRTAWGQRHRA